MEVNDGTAGATGIAIKTVKVVAGTANVGDSFVLKTSHQQLQYF